MKLLVDSAIWVDHFRRPNPALADAIRRRAALVHPFVVGEIAMGSIARRAEVLASLRLLREAVRADDDEVIDLIERHRLFGTGVGYVDAHLLASTLLTPNAKLWTRDKRLHAVAERLRVSAQVED